MKANETGKLTVYNFMTVDGYFEGLNGDISWHRPGPEENEFACEMLKAGHTLLFGRHTYNHMASFWPTPMAEEMFPEVAKGMNQADKIVFSRTMDQVDWNNCRLVSDGLAEEITSFKTKGVDMTLLGSGSIMKQLAECHLIDEIQLIINPTIIGKGTSIFQDLDFKMNLELIASRVFNSGTVLVSYKPV